MLYHWRFANAVWISKEENYNVIEQFRKNSLLDTENKIFFSILFQQMWIHIFVNN